MDESQSFDEQKVYILQNDVRPLDIPTENPVNIPAGEAQVLSDDSGFQSPTTNWIKDYPVSIQSKFQVFSRMYLTLLVLTEE